MIIDLTDTPASPASGILYPAGELQIRIKPERIAGIEASKEIIIKTRLEGKDLHFHLMGLLLLIDAIRGINPKARLILHLPYLPYSRGDRRFIEGDCHGLATFAQVLNTANFDEVRTLDVHHFGRANMFIKNFVNVIPKVQIYRAIADFEDFTGSTIAVLFPDAGAEKRYRDLIPEDVQVFYASKHRNSATGKFDGFEVPTIPKIPILMIDDLCDGGGTFLGIADMLPSDGQYGLYVTHGIFSKGMESLNAVFQRVYTTDSVQRVTNLHVWDSFMALVDNPVTADVLSNKAI